MKHSVRIIGISAFLLFLFSSAVVQSVADTNQQPILISKVEQDLHIEKMKGMNATEKAHYRNEQYKILRKKAASIGYKIPDNPPWTESDTAKAAESIDKAQASKTEVTTAKPATSPATERNPAYTVTATDSRHQKQLEKYRKAAAEKRKAMHERLERQRASVKERIAKLVEKNALKPVPEAPRFVPPPPRTARPFAPAPPMGPAYPHFYRMPPPPPIPPGYY